MELMFGIFSECFWWITPLLVSITTTLTGVITQGFKITQGWLKQLISWIIGSGLSCAAWGLKFIIFGEPVWLGVICLCLTVGLAANGIYDIPFIKAFVDKWFNKKPMYNYTEVTTPVTAPPTPPVYEPTITTEPIVVRPTTPPVEDLYITTPEVTTTTTPYVD